MRTEDARVFIQARMSSSRFPGKMLAPFRGRPLLRCVYDRVVASVSAPAVVLTSTEESDAPIRAYCESVGIPVFADDLRLVFVRFQQALHTYPCRWVFRVCGDSPLLFPDLFTQVWNDRKDRFGEYDVVTNVWPTRSYPHGQSLELFASKALAEVDARGLDAEEEEHVGPWFYRRPERYRIRTVENKRTPLQERFCVDTVADLARLEHLC